MAQKLSMVSTKPAKASKYPNNSASLRHAKYATRKREAGYRPRTLWLTDEQAKSVREFLAGRGLNPTPRPVPPAPSQSPTEQKTGTLEDVILGILLGLVTIAVVSWFR